MPRKGWKKAKLIVTTPPSPLKTRSGFVRRVSFSPLVVLQNVIQKASVNLDKMPDLLPRTPPGQVNHPLVHIETPRSTSGSGLSSEDRVLCSSLKKKLSFTHTGIVQHDSPVGEKEKTLVRVEPSTLDSSYVREENVEEEIEEEDGQSLVQYKENINQAEKTPFGKVMTQRTETMT